MDLDARPGRVCQSVSAYLIPMFCNCSAPSRLVKKQFL